MSYQALVPLITSVDATLVRPIRREIEALRLLVGYVGTISEAQVQALPELRQRVITHCYDLAALAIGARADTTQLAQGRGLRAGRLRAIKLDIVENLCNRDFSIDFIATRHRVTPRYIRMLFESEPLTFSEFVLNQRLHRAHRMLTDLRFADRNVSAIAFEAGFGDLSYFNRTFRRTYGATPSDVRAAALRVKD
jgi:AraC-like DNA-binding protein